MKETKFACLVLAASMFALGLGACASNQATQAVEGTAADEVITETFYHNSRNSLTWWGVYEGIIPSASGQGIKTRITLNRDYTFELWYEYLGTVASRTGGNVFTTTGTFQWDDTGSKIMLEGRNCPPFYQVGEHFLRQLDIYGNIIVGGLGDHYILQKVVP